MLIVQISDTHITGKGEKVYGIAPMNENLARCVGQINLLLPRPDIVLVTGDITNSGRQAEAENAAQILAGLKTPFYVIPGNHDERDVLRAVFGAQACPSVSGEFIHYVLEGFDLRLIAMDSVHQGYSGGRICSERAAWLDSCLAAVSEQPTVVFMHHPPVKFGVPETDRDGFEGAGLLAEVISSYGNIERIICGHTHLSAFAGWCGTIVSTAPSMGIQLVLDLTMRAPSRFILADPAFQLHYWSSDSILVSHNVCVGRDEKPFLFKEGL